MDSTILRYLGRNIRQWGRTRVAVSIGLAEKEDCESFIAVECAVMSANDL